MQSLLISLCLLPTLASAESLYEPNFLLLGDVQIPYEYVEEADTSGNGQTDRWSYYEANRITGSAFDNDGNGVPDMWIRIDRDWYVDMEIEDTDGDGKPDAFRKINRNEEVVNLMEVVPQEEAEDTPAAEGGMPWILLMIGVVVIIIGGMIMKKK